MFAEKYFQTLCSPAKLYLGISILILVFIVLQNLGSKRGKFCVGDHDTCFNLTAANLIVFLLFKCMWIALWTFVLNYSCRSGHSFWSWVLVLLPVILFLVLLVSLTIGPAFIYP